MPFKSDAQRRWMYKNEPAMAKRWAAETPANAKLPAKVGWRGSSDGMTRVKRKQGGSKKVS